jgi:hypothetical protein
VQYFPPGPDFPWANTQAATQRARMQAAGIDLGPAVPRVGPVGVPPAGGALSPLQNIPGQPTNVNTLRPEAPIPPQPGEVPAPPAPGAIPPPGGVVPGANAPDAGGDMPGGPGS